MLKVFVFCVASAFFALPSSAISPNRAPVNFANKIETRFVDTTDREQVYYFGNVWEPYDRDLPESGGYLCEQNEGTVVVDETVQEKYAYSCCLHSRCPLPPPEQPDVIRALLFERPVEVWAWNETWRKMDETFVYFDEMTLVGVAKRFLAAVVITTFVLGILSIVASLLHTGTNRFPALCFIIHVLTLTCIAIINAEAFYEVRNDSSYRGQLIRAGLVHTYIIMLMSPVIIYTPSTAEDEDQRIKTDWGIWLSKIAHTKCAKRFASIICLLHAVIGDALGSCPHGQCVVDSRRRVRSIGRDWFMLCCGDNGAYHWIYHGDSRN